MYEELEPARAKTKKPDKIWDDPDWSAEEKLDGWRFLMHFGGSCERTYLTGRRISKVTDLYSEKGLCAPMLSPDPVLKMGYTVLDGEVMPPEGADFRDLASIMNADPSSSARQVQRLGPPTYHAFDVLYHDGEDIRQSAQCGRKLMLDGLVPHLGTPGIILVPTLPARESVYDIVIQRGGEGLILKEGSMEYGQGWVKVKRVHTLDVVVTGFTDAKYGVTGKYLGLIGAAEVSVYTSDGSLLEVGRVSGMIDSVRVDMSENPNKYLGTVLEVAAQGWGKNRLRHPRFKRHRPEADPRSATFGKMLLDLNAEPTQPDQLSLPGA